LVVEFPENGETKVAEQLNFSPAFQPIDPVVLFSKKDGDVIVAYTSIYKGTRNFQIRILFKDGNGFWCPGREGFTVPEANKAKLVGAIAALKG
jgi:hypothetical protein